MKTMTAREAKNHFGEILDEARREPDYDGWLSGKVSSTSQRLDAGETVTYPHDEAMTRLHKRLAARLGVDEA